MEIILLNQILSAGAAFDLRLVTCVVSLSVLQEHTEQLVAQIANGPTVTIGQVKKLMRQSLQSDSHEQLAAESASFLTCAATDDFSEGPETFLEKQTAKYLKGSRSGLQYHCSVSYAKQALTQRLKANTAIEETDGAQVGVLNPVDQRRTPDGGLHHIPSGRIYINGRLD